jgi:hypothetical protein
VLRRRGGLLFPCRLLASNARNAFPGSWLKGNVAHSEISNPQKCVQSMTRTGLTSPPQRRRFRTGPATPYFGEPASIRQGLVVAQLGASLTLLIGAGLLAKSFLKLRDVDPGFRSDGVLTAEIRLAGPTYSSSQRQIEFYERLLVLLGHKNTCWVRGAKPGVS